MKIYNEIALSRFVPEPVRSLLMAKSSSWYVPPSSSVCAWDAQSVEGLGAGAKLKRNFPCHCSISSEFCSLLQKTTAVETDRWRDQLDVATESMKRVAAGIRLVLVE